MKSSVFYLVIALLLSTTNAHSTTESFDFSGTISEQRYRSLIEELRCLVCQNESLAGSNAELAGDLRKEVYQMMAQGQNDEQIIEFLVTRYGDFVLYNPPVKPSTYLLWFSPFILFIVAGLALYRSVRRRSRTAETQLTTEEQARLKQILGETPAGRDER